MRDRVAQGYHDVEEMIGRNPASSVLMVFGLGLGVGLWLGSALVEAERARRAHSATFTEKVGRQVLEAIAGVMPESIMPESLSNRLRHG
jgi:hypothetical protein